MAVCLHSLNGLLEEIIIYFLYRETLIGLLRGKDMSITINYDNMDNIHQHSEIYKKSLRIMASATSFANYIMENDNNDVYDADPRHGYVSFKSSNLKGNLEFDPETKDVRKMYCERTHSIDETNDETQIGRVDKRSIESVEEGKQYEVNGERIIMNANNSTVTYFAANE
jgi:hypothetical protein